MTYDPTGISAIDVKIGGEPDAHGQAALLFAESILHGLVENGVFSVAEAVAVVRTAAEVKEEVAMAAGESAERMQASLDLLERIEASFASSAGPPERFDR